LVVNGEVLAEDFVPEGLVGRRREVRLFMRGIGPAAKRRKPLHMWVYGASGSGKTALARWLLGELARRHRVYGAYVCCWLYGSLYKVVDALVEELRILRAEQQDTAFKLVKLEKHLDGRPFIVVLDDIDTVAPRERDGIIRGLCNLGQIGLVCISRKRDCFLGLDAGVRSRLHPLFIECGRYRPEHMARVLEERACAAVKTGSCSKAALERIVELSQGDARAAVQTLRNAAEWAEQQRDDRIEPRHVDRVCPAPGPVPKESLLAPLTQDHRMLNALVRERGQVASSDLRQAYLKRCAAIGRKPIAVRTFSKYVNQLARSGLLVCEQARMKGKVRLLSVPG